MMAGAFAEFAGDPVTATGAAIIYEPILFMMFAIMGAGIIWAIIMRDRGE